MKELMMKCFDQYAKLYLLRVFVKKPQNTVFNLERLIK